MGVDCSGSAMGCELSWHVMCRSAIPAATTRAVGTTGMTAPSRTRRRFVWRRSVLACTPTGLWRTLRAP